MQYSVYLGSKFYIQGQINNIYFKFHNFYLNEKLSLILEYEYIDQYNISFIMYEYVSDRNVSKITLIKNKDTDLIDVIDIANVDKIFKFRNYRTALQYPVDNDVVCLILSNI